MGTFLFFYWGRRDRGRPNICVVDDGLALDRTVLAAFVDELVGFFCGFLLFCCV